MQRFTLIKCFAGRVFRDGMGLEGTGLDCTEWSIVGASIYDSAGLALCVVFVFTPLGSYDGILLLAFHILEYSGMEELGFSYWAFLALMDGILI